jgi:hypothetical protein
VAATDSALTGLRSMAAAGRCSMAATLCRFMTAAGRRFMAFFLGKGHDGTDQQCCEQSCKLFHARSSFLLRLLC